MRRILIRNFYVAPCDLKPQAFKNPTAKRLSKKVIKLTLKFTKINKRSLFINLTTSIYLSALKKRMETYFRLLNIPLEIHFNVGALNLFNFEEQSLFKVIMISDYRTWENFTFLIVIRNVRVVHSSSSL